MLNVPNDPPRSSPSDSKIDITVNFLSQSLVSSPFYRTQKCHRKWNEMFSPHLCPLIDCFKQKRSSVRSVDESNFVWRFFDQNFLCYVQNLSVGVDANCGLRKLREFSKGLVSSSPALELPRSDILSPSYHTYLRISRIPDPFPFLRYDALEFTVE